MDQQRSSIRRRGRIVALAVGLLLVALGVAVAGVLGPRLRSWVIEEASNRGVRLSFADYSIGFGELRLDGVSFAREKPLPITGQAKSVTLHFAGFKPQSVEITQLQVDILSSVPDLLYELRGLSTSSQGEEQIPVTASAALLRWKTSSQNPPALLLTNATLALDAERLQTSGDLSAAEHALGKASLTSSFRTRKSTVELSFTGAATGSLNAEINVSADPATLDLTLKPTHLSTALPGLALQSSRGGDVSGSLSLAFPTGLSTRGANGKGSLSFDGFVPPYPPELQGFQFASRTDLQSELVLSRDYRTVTLKNTELQAGELTLAGSGTLERHDSYATVHLQMTGRVACASIASSAAKANLGAVLGKMLSNAALQAVEGTVDVAIKVQADSRDLEAMQIDKTIGLGCGLRPTKLQAPPLPK